MGADAAPRVEVEGVARRGARARASTSSWSATSPGCAPSSTALGAERRERIVVRHAPEVITMHDAPSMAVKQKKKSSMRICFDLVKAGEVDAVVSAGQLGRHDGLRPVRAGAAARRRAARHRDHLPDAQPASARCSTWAPTSIRSRRVLAQFARARLGLRAPAARQGAPPGGPAVERLRGAQGHGADARGAPAPGPRVPERRRPTSTTSATSRGATSSRGEVDVVVTDGFTGNVAAQERRGRGRGDPRDGARGGHALGAPGASWAPR